MAEFFGDNLSGIKSTLWKNGLFSRDEIAWYDKFNRFGCKDPYDALSGHKEYLFFTKPDLNLVIPNVSNLTLNPELKNNPYFSELFEQLPEVMAQLQLSNRTQYGCNSPFINLLTNSVKNTLEIPGISANTIDNPATIYGTAYNYRDWGYSSDEKVEFSLEFEDTKYLEIYHLLKAYEEYERLKHLGLVTPPNIDNAPVNKAGLCFSYYIRNKVIHDQFSVYKFIVEDDGETIIHYSKLWGVFFKNVPRDAFSDLKDDGGLTYAVEFEAAFIEDMNPMILTDFNHVVSEYIKNKPTLAPVYDSEKGIIDNSWVSMPVIYKVRNNNKNWLGPKTMKYTYKLKWRK